MKSAVARRYSVRWSPDKPVTPLVLDSLLEDMGIGMVGSEDDPEVRKATCDYCLQAVLDSIYAGYELRIGELERMARAFCDGYIAGRRSR